MQDADRFLVVTVNAGSASARLAAFESDGTMVRLLDRRLLRSDNADPRSSLGSFLDRLDRHRLRCVAHRIVHGGTRLTQPVRVDADVQAQIAALAEMAPLHNPPALAWIEAARELCGGAVVQAAAFDTAFFARLPRLAAEYAVPSPIAGQGVKRYGFHGIAHEALWRRWCELRPGLPRGGRLVTLQLGGGSSVTAIDRGEPVDTSMGFSPLEGLVMKTRSGDIDPSVVPFLAGRLGWSADRVLAMLNRESGLAGLSGTSGDMREVLASDSPQSRFAVDLYCYRASKAIGAFLVALGGCDGIVFGGGVSEHEPSIRARIVERLRWAGISLDVAANQAQRGTEALISDAHSIAPVYVLLVDEETQLARAALQVLP